MSDSETSPIANPPRRSRTHTLPDMDCLIERITAKDSKIASQAAFNLVRLATQTTPESALALRLAINFINTSERESSDNIRRYYSQCGAQLLRDCVLADRLPEEQRSQYKGMLRGVFDHFAQTVKSEESRNAYQQAAQKLESTPTVQPT